MIQEPQKPKIFKHKNGQTKSVATRAIKSQHSDSEKEHNEPMWRP